MRKHGSPYPQLEGPRQTTKGWAKRGCVEKWCPLESATFDPGKCIEGGISSIPLKWHHVAPSSTTFETGGL